MKSNRIIALAGILALLAFAVAGSGAGAQGPTPVSPPLGGTEGGEGDTPGDWVAPAISYQGRLTNPATGAPLSGVYDLEFTFWSLPSGGVQFGATILKDDQTITNGLYSTTLAVNPADFFGQELWLRLRVKPGTGGSWETLNPRVQVLPTAYALSLRPGASIQGSVAAPNAIVMATNLASGWGLRGESQDPSGYGVYGYNGSASASAYGGGILGTTLASGYGVRGESNNGYGVSGYTRDGYAVWGYDGGTTDARGYGGYFTSANGVGVYGYSGATPMWNNMYAPGVYGRSANGVGVYGFTDGTSWSAAGGVFVGRVGLEATGTGTSAQGGYAGSFVSKYYRGIYVVSQGGWYDGYFAGIGGVYSAGGYYSLRADRTLVVNGGGETLEPGDVVAIAGVSKPLLAGGEPLLAVRKASGATDAAVVGVVVQAVQVQEVAAPGDSSGRKSVDVQPVEGHVPPGGYLAIVTHGLAPAVKVNSAKAEGLRVGDLVSPAASGQVEKAETQYPAGAILGKVAGPYDPQTGTIPVFVTLQ